MNGAKVRPRRRRRACVLLDKQFNSHSRNTQNSRRVVERGRKLMMGEREGRERYLNTGTRFFLGGVRTLGRKFGRKRVRVWEQNGRHNKRRRTVRFGKRTVLTEGAN